jgi:hypothetical protein
MLSIKNESDAARQLDKVREIMELDKRKYPRVTTSMDVLYYTGGAPDEGTGRVHYFGTVTDLSLGGVRLVVEHPHGTDERIWLQGVRGAPDIIPGRVRWIHGEQEHYNMGVEFLIPV